MNAEIWMAAAEASPLAQSGGLGEVLRALPEAMVRVGFEVRRLIPAYGFIKREGFQLEKSMKVISGEELLDVQLFSKRETSGVTTTLVVCDEMFRRSGMYGPSGQDYPDNARRFSLFCRAVVQAAAEADRPPAVLHAHDWPAGLIPLYVRFAYDWKVKPKTVFSIHNLGYQGYFSAGELHWLSLSEKVVTEVFQPTGLEYYGGINFLKAGLQYSDRLLTVSPAYAKDIVTPDFGCGLDGVLRDRKKDLLGILNGIDEELWNPMKDTYLPAKYEADEFVHAKEAAARVVREAFDVKPARRPIVGMVGRLVHQKGIDIVLEAVVRLIALGTDICIIGDGDPALAEQLLRLQAHLPGRIGVQIRFDERLAHLLVAGSDMILLPSRYEPCGLTQMYAMRYGAVPIAHRTGGFIDTITDVTVSPDQGTGFLFSPLDPDQLVAAVRTAMDVYKNDPDRWMAIQKRGMKRDFSWDAAAQQYAREIGGHTTEPELS